MSRLATLRSLKDGPSLVFAIALSVLPSNAMRVSAHRRRKGFAVAAGVKIGWLSILEVDSASFESGSRVGHMCLFRRVGHLELRNGAMIGHRNGFFSVRRAIIGERTVIGYKNRFQGAEWLGDWVEDARDGAFEMGADGLMTSGHFFDTAGGVSIGSRTTIGGRGSEFWTHGVSMRRTGAVSIGDDCYIGSGVKVAAGVTIPDHCLVSLGSVVGQSPDSQDSVLSGNPAVTVRTDQRPGWQSKSVG